MKNNSIKSITTFIISGTLYAGNVFAASEIDTRIEEAAANSYVFKSYLKDDSVKTSSEDGNVTLTGDVLYDYHKTLAQDTVEGLPGVKSVTNKINIKENEATKGSDLYLTRKIRAILVTHKNLNADETEVSTTNGEVHLKGLADSVAQKDLTTEYAKDVNGVKNVENSMVVTNSNKSKERNIFDKIDDSSITAQIKMSLLFHRSTSSLKTEIKTMDGVVTVNGMAENASERSLVTKLVSDIHGVKSVNNKMSVKK